jgi:hypothetical protein
LRPHAGGDGPPSFVVVERAQGQFLIAKGEDGAARLARSPAAGTLILKDALTRSEGPGGAPAHLAESTLHGRALDDAARAIAETWRARHGR